MENKIPRKSRRSKGKSCIKNKFEAVGKERKIDRNNKEKERRRERKRAKERIKENRKRGEGK